MAKNDDQPRDENGQFAKSSSNGNSGGNKKEPTKEQKAKLDEMKKGLKEILVNGKEEVLIKSCRSDLDSVANLGCRASNDISIVRGNEGKGVLHILKNGRGEERLGEVLDAIVLGEIDPEYKKRTTLKIKHGDIDVILAYEKDSKTWLLTGWDRKKDKKPTSDSRSEFYSTLKPTHITPTGTRCYLGADEELNEIINDFVFKSRKIKDMNIALDKNTKRHIDANGFMHVAVSNISKEIVNPYYGYEIPNYAELGLDPDKVYNVYRTGKALEEGAKSFNNLPLMRDHYIDSAEEPQREHHVWLCCSFSGNSWHSLLVLASQLLKKYKQSILADIFV